MIHSMLICFWTARVSECIPSVMCAAPPGDRMLQAPQQSTLSSSPCRPLQAPSAQRSPQA